MKEIKISGMGCQKCVDAVTAALNDAEIQIDENLRNMYDMIINAINVIEKNDKNEYKIFKEIKDIKSDTLSSFELDRKLSKVYSTILEIGNDIQKLEKNRSYNSIKENLRVIEEKLIGLRSFYNKYVSEYNLLIKSFPSGFIAKLGSFKYKNHYDGKDLTDDILNDFKL